MKIISEFYLSSDIFDNSRDRGHDRDRDRERDRETQSSASYSSTPSWDPYYDQGSYKDYQYDSYNPKYNNNPDSHGYQETYRPMDYDAPEYVHHRGADMYGSASSHRPKKISSSGSHRVSHGKRPKPYRKSKSKHRTSKRFSLHSRDLDRDLTPPPADEK